jgi:hypothetical protein
VAAKAAGKVNPTTMNFAMLLVFTVGSRALIAVVADFYWMLIRPPKLRFRFWIASDRSLPAAVFGPVALGALRRLASICRCEVMRKRRW